MKRKKSRQMHFSDSSLMILRKRLIQALVVDVVEAEVVDVMAKEHALRQMS